MPAHSNTYPWPSYYGNFNFALEILARHDQLASIDPDGDVYNVARTRGDQLRLFICECYSFGVAEYQEVTEKAGPVDLVLVNSNWCSYTLQVKRHCREQKVGVYQLRALMAALNLNEVWSYLDEGERELFKERGWI